MEEQLLLVDSKKLVDVLEEMNNTYCEEQGLCAECRCPLKYTPPTWDDPGDWYCPRGC